MTIHLPEHLKRYVHDQVLAGRYITEDEVIRTPWSGTGRPSSPRPPRRTRRTTPTRNCNAACSRPGSSAKSSRRSPT